MASAEYYKELRNKQRIKAIDYLGGECAKCKATDKLEFDHIVSRINGGKKYGCVSSMLHYRWETLTAELDLCQLLCKECHKDKTKIDTAGMVPANKNCHGESRYRKQGCRCKVCVDAHLKVTRDRREKRRVIRDASAKARPASKLPRGVEVLKSGRFRAKTTVDYKTVRLGVFDTPEEANAAYVEHNRKLRPEFDVSLKYNI